MKTEIIVIVAVLSALAIAILLYYFIKFSKNLFKTRRPQKDNNSDTDLPKDDNDKPEEQEQEQDQNTKHILRIFGAGDSENYNNGKSKFQNVRQRIVDVRFSVEKFYDENIKVNGDNLEFIENKNLIKDFKKTEFETKHSFIQYFFPSKAISKKSLESKAPFVSNPSAIKDLIKDGRIDESCIYNRFENFQHALTFYLKTTGIHYAMPSSPDKVEAQMQQSLTDNIQQKIKNELINGSAIDHNQFRITRVIESIDIHLQFLKYAKEAYIELSESPEEWNLPAMSHIAQVKNTFDQNLNEYIIDIFSYISELVTVEKNKTFAFYQANAFLDLLSHLDEEFKSNTEKLNDIQKPLFNKIQTIRSDFKGKIFDKLTSNNQSTLEVKMNHFIKQQMRLDVLDKVLFDREVV